MNEIVTAARSAREKLSSALAVLQSPAAGNLIDSVAEPVAGAMSALHSIESSGGATLAERAPVALASVRRALEALQAAPQGPAADEATGHVAGCLGLVHQLAQKASAAQAPAAAPTAQVRPSERPPAPRPSERPPAPRPSERPPAPAAQPSPHAAFAQTALAGSPAAPGGSLDRTQLADAAQQYVAPAQPAHQQPVQQAPVQQAPVQHAPVQQQAPAYQPAPVAQQQQPVAASVIPASAAAAAAAAPRAPAGAAVVEAALGAHSPTNFYKGLSGNDVIDDGGVFVATYRIPRIGQEIWLRVSMPGGYEFDARAEVKWTRESGTSDAPPGFGAQFREISNEGRQLVYRYVRNREPLFHDDF